MDGTTNITKLAAALVAAQKEIAKVLKNAENPYFKNKYADLTAVIDSVKGPLNNHGISFLQLVGHDEQGNDVVETVLLHESGEYIGTKTRVCCEKVNNAQSFGSGITYAKRYALQAVLGLPTEDDDGADASIKPRTPTPKVKEKDPAAMTKAISNAFAEYVEKNLELLNEQPNLGFDVDLFNAEVMRLKDGKKTLAQIVSEVGALAVMKEI